MALEKIPPTAGLNIAKIDSQRHAEFMLWDVGGQSVLRKIWEKYFTQCHGIIYVLDGADQIRFDEVRETLSKMYDKEGNMEDVLKDLPVLFLINKSDQESEF